METLENLQCPADLDLTAPLELNIDELDEVQGGLAPVLLAFAAGVAVGWLMRGQ